MNETIAAVASLISATAAAVAVIMSVLSYRASSRNGRKIDDVHVSVNSRMDQLLTQKGLASEAKGAADERSKTTV